jgi:hypothetical protein
MNQLRFRTLVLICLPTLLFACDQPATNKDAAATIATSSSDTTPHSNSTRPRKSLMNGNGTLSFKLDGQLYETDPTTTKCWTTSNIPLTMMMAKGKDMSVSWQLQSIKGGGSYKIDNDSKGTVGFTIGEKMYWVRRTDGSNYLNIQITSTKNIGTVVLLSGTFNGVLEDKEGNKVQVTEGKFTTESL